MHSSKGRGRAFAAIPNKGPKIRAKDQASAPAGTPPSMPPSACTLRRHSSTLPSRNPIVAGRITKVELATVLNTVADSSAWQLVSSVLRSKEVGLSTADLAVATFWKKSRAKNSKAF